MKECDNRNRKLVSIGKQLGHYTLYWKRHLTV